MSITERSVYSFQFEYDNFYRNINILFLNVFEADMECHLFLILKKFV